MSELYFKKYLKYKQKYFNEVYGGNTPLFDELLILKQNITSVAAAFTDKLNTLNLTIETTLVPKLNTICSSSGTFPEGTFVVRPYTLEQFVIDSGRIPSAKMILQILKHSKYPKKSEYLINLFTKYNTLIEQIYVILPKSIESAYIFLDEFKFSKNDDASTLEQLKKNYTAIAAELTTYYEKDYISELTQEIDTQIPKI